jgi:putative ABC transport system permease protein
MSALDGLVVEVRQRARTLFRDPGFLAVAALTLALGIGVCTAMFGVVDAVLLRPLPFREPDRLVWIENDSGGDLSGRTTRVDTFNGWREQSRSFEALAAYFAFFDYGRATLTGGGAPERVRNVGVSHDFLPTLGVSLLYGRNFTAEECAWHGPRAVILGYSFWRRRFGGDPAVVGGTTTLDDEPATVAGVLPSTFDFDQVFAPGTEVDVLTPFPLTPETARWGNTLFAIGRLRPAATVQSAQAELTVISERLQATIPGSFGAVVRPIDEALRGRFRAPFLMLAGAVACVFLIACVNLSNLLLTRVNARRREFAVRVAIGASRGQLVRQALVESLLLAALGCVVGVPAAAWSTRALARLHTFGVPMLQAARVDGLALAVAICLATLAAMACTVLPALHLAGGHHGRVVARATHQRSAGRWQAAARSGLVIAEVALACVLLVGAGLLFRSFSAVLQVRLGFEPRHAVSWRLDSPRRFANAAEAKTYFGGLLERVAAVPGVEGVGLSDCLPLGRSRTWGAGVQGVDYPEGEFPEAQPRVVDPGYLRVMRIPLRAGRLLDERDGPDAEKAIVINETLARRLFPDRDPIGQMLTPLGGTRVVGVVGDVRAHSPEEAAGNEMYLSYLQTGDWGGLEMVVRSARPPESLVPDVRAAVASWDPGLPTGEYRELESLVDDAVAPRRLITRLLGLFSSLALGLAALGLYAMIAYSVGQRTQEIGIRMAVGASRREVLGMVVGSGLRLAAVGVLVGLGIALAATRVLQSLLFGVAARDPAVFAGNAALLVAIAALACAVPAWRAARVDPAVTLRAD